MWIEKVSLSTIVSLLLCLTVEAQNLSYKDFRLHNHEESTNDYIKVLEHYDTIDKENMNEDTLHDYSMTAFYLQQYDKALEVAKFGLSRNPRHAGFNRLAFFNLAELKRYDEALQYADALFHKSDSAQFSYYDYTYYGSAYFSTQQYDKAIEMYLLAIEQKDVDSKTKRAGIANLLSDAYMAKKDCPNAIRYYKEYIACIDKPTANDIAGLAGLYVEQANSIKDLDEKRTVLIEADTIYADLANKYENAVEYANFMRARVNVQMDPDSKLGLAKPYYEKLIELIEPRAEKDATERARITEAYRYLMAYNFMVRGDQETAKAFATKLQAIDPENEIAKQVLEAK
jgi:tetratricopeptide (TPR) repeat protein